MKSFLKSGYDYSKQLSENFNVYLSSGQYEEDLDEIISFLYILKPLQSRNFDAIRNRQLRVAMKMKFIFSQSRLLIAASATIGAEVGLMVGGPQGAVAGATIGTTTGALAISFVSERVLIKRWSAQAAEFAT